MKQIATRLTALLLALVMTTTLALAANKSGYSDVPDKNWASQSIAQCKQYNLLQGIGNGKFGLGQKMTRAAYAAALCRLMGWKTVTPEKGSFTASAAAVEKRRPAGSPNRRSVRCLRHGHRAPDRVRT